MNALCFQPFPVIKTQRLVLRALVLNDADFIFQLRTSLENATYLDLPIPKQPSDCIAHIERMQKGLAENKYIYWAIDKVEDQTMIGTICLWNFNNETERAELGYELHPSAQQQGYMSEALSAVIDYAINKIGLAKLEAYTHEKNESSSRLLEKHDFRIVGYKKETHSRTGIDFRYAIYSKSYL